MAAPLYRVCVDIESTGLDLGRPRASILEFAMIVTDPAGVKLTEFESFVHAEAWRADCEAGALQLHEDSGLAVMLDDLAVTAPSIGEVDRVACAALTDAGFTTDSKLILSGSNVAGYDRAWLRRFMPSFESAFVYRTLDVSPIRETLRVAGRKDLTWDEHRKRDGMPERLKHHAMADAEDSWKEWCHYADMFRMVGDGR